MRLTAILALLAFATAAHGQDDDKHARLRRLQTASRVYQVCLGRAPNAGESAHLISQNDDQVVQHLVASEEAAAVYARRLATYVEGSEGATETKVPPAVQQVAKLNDKLDDVLAKVGKDRHKGEPCGDKAASVCFASWLVKRVAPALGYEWVGQREQDLAQWSYAKLIEEISRSSLQ